MKNRLISLILTCLTSYSLLFAATPKDNNSPYQQRFTILGLGDSITEGGDFFTCYLFPLWQKLFSAGYEFDFIGSRQSKCRIGTLNHCGFSGHTVEFLDKSIDSLYHQFPADIVLLHAGHNHFVEEKPIPSMMSAYRSIIRKIHAINPQAHIIIAQVVTSGKLPKYSYIPELNRQIEAEFSNRENERIYVVNQAKGFDWTKDTVHDKVHPNASGGEKMATVWFEKLKTILKPAKQSFNPDIVKYKTLANGDSLCLHIFHPEGKQKKARPAIVYFFGGGWTYGTPIQFYRECAYYASKGMVAVSADYRIASIHKTTPFECVEDAKDVIIWLRGHARELGIDPQRIATSGASAGGHLASSVGTIGTTGTKVAPYCPNLMILNYPVVDNPLHGFGFQALAARYKEIAPLYHVSSNTPPTLFLLGTKDHYVPVSVAKAFQDTLQHHGVECQLNLFEGAGHPIFLYRQPLTENFYKIREITDDFLIRHKYLSGKKRKPAHTQH